LYLLLKHAMLAQYVHSAFDILIKAGPATDADRLDSEFVNLHIGFGPAKRPPVWNRLSEPVPGVTDSVALGDYLYAGFPATDDYRATLRQLGKLPTRELERLMTETLDTSSHRIDAWITSLVTQRLDAMRLAHREGCHIGGYGWVEHLRPRPKASLTA